MKKTPKTHRTKDEEIGGELCQCQECGVEAICSMRFDFYTLSFKQYKDEELRPLYCESCLWTLARSQTLPFK